MHNLLMVQNLIEPTLKNYNRKKSCVKKNAYTVKNAEAELQILRSIFDYIILIQIYPISKIDIIFLKVIQEIQYLDKILNLEQYWYICRFKSKIQNRSNCRLGLQHLFK